MIDIVTMDIHRDLDTKNWGKTIMKALAEKLGYNLPNPYEIMSGDIFDLETPNMALVQGCS